MYNYMQKTHISDRCKYWIWNSIVNIGMSKATIYDILVKKNYDRYVVINELSYDPDDADYGAVHDDDMGETGTVQQFPEIATDPMQITTGDAKDAKDAKDATQRTERSIPISLSGLVNVPNDLDTEIYRDMGPVMSDDDRKYMIEQIREHALPSTVLKGGRSVRDVTSRTSKTHYFHRDEVAQRVLRGILKRLGIETREKQVESVQGTSYDVGCQYKEHYDYIFDMDNVIRNGQRNWTILVYLNDDYTGGKTRFIKHDITVDPQANTALIWNNIHGDKVDPNTLHEATPVKSGIKYVLQIWIRNK